MLLPLQLNLETAASGTGSLSQTLGALTVSAAGTVDVAGASGQTLAALTSSATGAVAVSGTESTTLAALTLVADGTVSGAVEGTLSITLDSLRLTAEGIGPSVPAPPGVGSTGGGGGSIWYQGKRAPKRELNKELDDILNRSVAEMYAELAEASAPIQAQAAKVVRPFADDRKAEVPKAIDWTAIERDATRVRRLISLWRQMQTAREIDAEDEEWFLLN